jgi:glutathione S-transferase
MKLYYSPGACSLADHIALIEGGITFERESVDLKSKVTASGADFTTINPKGYVPVLVLDSGEVMTENLAVLDWITVQVPSLGLDGPMGRTRLLEVLAYISSELHKSYHPLFHGASDAEKAGARVMVDKKLQLLADGMKGSYLFGDRPTVADYYLFVTLLWAAKFGISIPKRLRALRDRLLTRPAVRAAMTNEGLALELPDDDMRAAAPQVVHTASA